MYRSRSSRALFLAAAVLASLVLQVAHAAEGVDEPLRTTRAGEIGGSRSANYFAWQKTTRDRVHVWVKPDGASAFRANPRGTQAGMGSLDGDRLVYVQFGRRDSNIKIMDLATRRIRSVGRASTRRPEYSPRIDGRWLLFERHYPGQRRQVLFLTNLRSGATRRIAAMPLGGYLQTGQVSGDYVVFLQWSGRGLSKVKRYRISTRSTVTIPNNSLHNWGPSVTPAGTVYFGRSTSRCGRRSGLFRWRPGSSAQLVVNFADGLDMAVSDVFVSPQGNIRVAHDKTPCANLRNSDIYEYEDPFTVLLTVTKAGNRTGTVSGRGIACGTDCTQYFEPGTTVTLTATPEEGARFDSWSDPSCGSNTTCTISVTADTTITASFRP
jgi:hypothetical protein